MADADDGSRAGDADLARARLRGKRVALVVVVAIALAFIGDSAFQIVPAVFAARVAPVGSGTGQHDCAVGVQRLARALDRAAGPIVSRGGAEGRGSEGAATALEGASATAARRARSPEWDQAGAVEEACKGSSEGLEAWAALERLRMAEDQLSVQSDAELGPLRRDVAAHLPSDLR